MKLVANWKDIVRRAWSVRFMVLAGLLSALEAAAPFFSDSFRPGVFGAVSGLLVGAAFVARLLAQKDIE